jgi:hypothetical protein
MLLFANVFPLKTDKNCYFCYYAVFQKLNCKIVLKNLEGREDKERKRKQVRQEGIFKADIFNCSISRRRKRLRQKKTPKSLTRR